ncbi:MAG: hypothetical protein COB22_07820, partial [Cycloclasticus sp.]
KTITLGGLSETDTLGALTELNTQLLGTVVEIDSLSGLTSTKAAMLGGLSEVDTLGTVTGTLLPDYTRVSKQSNFDALAG